MKKNYRSTRSLNFLQDVPWNSVLCRSSFISATVSKCLLKTSNLDGLNREYAVVYFLGSFKMYKTGIKHIWKLECPSQRNKDQECCRVSISGIVWAGAGKTKWRENIT